MAKNFKPEDIEEFRECFYLYNKTGMVLRESQLAFTMRSLAFSPTVREIRRYWTKYSKDGQLDFPSFLETLHEHSQNEDCEREILAAFEAHDTGKTGTIGAKEFRGVLKRLGERLSDREIDAILRDGKQTGSRIAYRELVKNLLTPTPDY